MRKCMCGWLSPDFAAVFMRWVDALLGAEFVICVLIFGLIRYERRKTSIGLQVVFSKYKKRKGGPFNP
jgi:hypothetical protein